MGRTIDPPDDRLSRLLYAGQLSVLLPALLFVAPRLDGLAGVLIALLLGVLVTATALGLWRTATDEDGRTHLGTAEDITSDPFADPGLAAGGTWETPVRRLPDGHDERD